MNESKFLRNKNSKNNNRNSFKKHISIFITQVLVCVLILLILLISVKKTPTLKEKINTKLFESNLSFAKINEWYKNTFGEVLPFDNVLVNESVEVFNEKLTYKEESLYKDGVKLTVNNNYLVPILESGIIVFIGEKENYGNTIIIQQVNGIDVWYGNITNTNDNIKLYDYVTKGNLLGEANGEYIYLAFQKEGKFIDYKECL